MRYEQFAEKLALEYQKKGLADGKSVPGPTPSVQVTEEKLESDPRCCL